MKSLTILLMPMVMLALVGCGGSEGDAGNAAEPTLVVAFDTGPTNLDVRVGTDSASGRIFDLVYAGLVKPTPELDYAPDVAESWTISDDSRTITFKLRKDAKFHDGRPITSEDVKWTFDSMLAESFQSPKKAGYAAVEAFEAPDPHTFVVRLKEPNAGIFDNFTHMLVPKGADANTFKSAPVGAGPYKLTELVADERVRLEGFDGYWAGAPNIENVMVRVIPDATTRVLELRKGTVNFALNAVPYDSVAQFEKDPNYKVIKEPGAAYQYLAFNLRDPILKKKEVRQAIAYAIDRQKIVDDLLLGYGKVTDTIFPEGHWARAEGLPSFGYEPQKAMQLLDQAGHRDPDGNGPAARFSLSYKTSTDREAIQQAEMVQQMLKQVGIAVDIQSNEFGTFFEDIQKGNFQLFSLRRIGVADPDFYHVIFHSDSLPPEGQNRGYYVNPTIDGLIEQGRSTFDREKRREAYTRIQQITAEELPYVSLYHRYNIAIMDRKFGNFTMYPSGFLLGIPGMTVEK